MNKGNIPQGKFKKRDKEGAARRRKEALEELKKAMNDKETLSEVFRDEEMIREIMSFNGLIYKFAESLENSIKKTQIRKFFEPIRRLEDEAKRKNEEEELKAEQILELNRWITLAAYNVGRGVIPNEFLDFIRFLVDKTKKFGDITYLADIFHALISYYEYINPSRS